MQETLTIKVRYLSDKIQPLNISTASPIGLTFGLLRILS